MIALHMDFVQNQTQIYVVELIWYQRMSSVFRPNPADSSGNSSASLGQRIAVFEDSHCCEFSPVLNRSFYC